MYTMATAFTSTVLNKAAFAGKAVRSERAVGPKVCNTIHREREREANERQTREKEGEKKRIKEVASMGIEKDLFV